ncbi:MAG: hypothetical protein AAFN10_19920, partial [Bacteroidota bacterium]
MSKHLPALFVILLSSSLVYFVYQHFQMQAVIAEYQSFEEDFVNNREDQLRDLELVMLADIEDEIGDMNKLTNAGMMDTIKQLRAEMNALMKQESISNEELRCWNT